ncbi:MAG TPA: hypothetical protein VLA91_01815 [Acidimicrobiia bacterium]|nr:hypothetical protein [Acidimicrobiia bacterium]
MPSEMRRPRTVDIADYVAALDRQLREEVVRTERRSLPQVFHRMARVLRTTLQPILQSGAIVLTSFAIIVAVGAAPASMRTPPSPDTPLATPSRPAVVVGVSSEIRSNLPADEFLAVAEESTSVQEADNSDMPPMTME